MSSNYSSSSTIPNYDENYPEFPINEATNFKNRYVDMGEMTSALNPFLVPYDSDAKVRAIFWKILYLELSKKSYTNFTIL